MKSFFTTCFAMVFFLVSCGEEDRKVIVYDDNNSTQDEENSDNEIQDMTADESPDHVINDEAVDEVNDETQDEIEDNEPDNVQDEVNDEDNSDCIGLGGTTGAYPNAPECCEGLQRSAVFEIVYENKVGYCQGLVGGVVCINCGNGNCENGEDLCNCPSDCLESRDERCDDGMDVCDMVPPNDCEGSDMLAVKDGCWACVDPLSCEPSDRQAQCDDGTIPNCKTLVQCEDGEVLAYVDNCYSCLDEETCK